MQNTRLRQCCVMGHTPEGISRLEQEIKNDLQRTILQAIEDGFCSFLVSVEPGVGLWAAQIILLERSRNPEIRLTAVVSKDGFQKFPVNTGTAYLSILQDADTVEIIDEDRQGWHARVRWMVDHSSRTIAVYNGAPGAVRNLIDYTMLRHVPFRVIPA